MPDNNYTIEPSHNPLQGTTFVCLITTELLLRSSYHTRKILMGAQEQRFSLITATLWNSFLELMTGARDTQQILNFVAAKGIGVVRTLHLLKSHHPILYIFI